MSFLARARALFRSPADRRLEEARAAAFDKAPRPVAPSSALAITDAGGGLLPPAPPPVNWWQEQPSPPPGRFSFQPGYSDHTYQQFSMPLAFEGFVLQRIRQAIAMHRLGLFYESWALSIAILGFAPVLAALGQAIAPILDNAAKARIVGGNVGLARMVAGEVEAQLCPRHGLLPSRYLEPQVWGTMAIYLRMLGFCVLQHVDGDPDPVTGVRPRFTRIWEPYAVRRQPLPMKWFAMTSEGDVEIKNDGKFTLVADSLHPHLTDAAILALGEETLAGKMTQESRAAWIDRNGQIKWIATLPEKVPTHGEAGDAFYAAVEGIAGPEGLGIFPFGSTFQAVALTRDTSGAFGETLRNAMAHIGMVLVGSPGPLNEGSEGVYQPKDGGKWDVRNDLVDRPVIAMVRGLNQGHIKPYCDINYSEAIDRARRAGAWTYPALSIPLPDRERDARVESIVKREKARCEITDMRKASGYEFTNDDAIDLATDLELRHLTLAEKSQSPKPPIDAAPTDVVKVFTADEIRASRGYDGIGDDRGKLTIPELDARAVAKNTPLASDPAEDQPKQEEPTT